MSYSHFVILNTNIVEVVISTTAIVSPKIYIPSSSCEIENFINNIFLFYNSKYDLLISIFVSQGWGSMVFLYSQNRETPGINTRINT